MVLTLAAQFYSMVLEEENPTRFDFQIDGCSYAWASLELTRCAWAVAWLLVNSPSSQVLLDDHDVIPSSSGTKKVPALLKNILIEQCTSSGVCSQLACIWYLREHYASISAMYGPSTWSVRSTSWPVYCLHIEQCTSSGVCSQLACIWYLREHYASISAMYGEANPTNLSTCRSW